MSALQDLLAQKQALEKKIVEVQRAERAEAISRIKALMTEYGLTSADLSGRAAAPKSDKAAGKVAPKFRNAATGETWSGRGLQPKWLKAALASGKKLADFKL